MPERRSPLREPLQALERELRALEVELVGAETRLHALASSDPKGEEARELELRQPRLEERLRRQRQEAKELRARIEEEESRQGPGSGDEGDETGEPGVEPGDGGGAWSFGDMLEDLERDLPILLLPVRIETRYLPVDREQDLWELLIRIYPDELHLDTHEEELTAVEIEWGQHFWQQVWKWGNQPERTQKAWEQLVGRFGGPRASWVAESLRPRPIRPETLTRPIPDSVRESVKLEFPEVAPRATTWTRAARANMLPDVWVAWGWREGQVRLTAPSRPVRRDLAVGPDPASLQEPGEGELPIDDGMRWMVDFEAAIEAGMAMRVLIGKRTRYDLLVVFGLRGGAPRQLSEELERHFAALRFGRGLDFVRQGTPTNNTDATRSGWELGEDDDGSTEAMLRELGPLPNGQPRSNARVLAEALWLRPAGFARLPHGQETEQLDAAMMSSLLWAASWGYYLKEMIGPLVIPYNQLRDWTYEHWVEYVRGRGPIPAIRAGDQPYGVLPVLVGQVKDPRGPAHPEDPLEVILRTAREVWDASAPHVTQVRVDSPESDKDLVQALATLPHPERFAVRGVVDRLTMGSVWPPGSWTGLNFRLTGPGSLIRQVLAGFGLGGQPVLLDTLYSNGSREWVGPLVTSVPLSATDPLGAVSPDGSSLEGQGAGGAPDEEGAVGAPDEEGAVGAPDEEGAVGAPDEEGSGGAPDQVDNYLTWMAGSAIGSLGNESHPFEKDPLLYVLARRSGMLEDGGAGGGPDRWRSAARHLAGLPSATLDQLLRETLGTCGYRLDAWETSLATRQLEVIRKRVEESTTLEGGIQIGGFGWVADLRPDPPLRVVPEPEPSENGEDDRQDEGEDPDPSVVMIDPANKGYVHAPSLQHAVTAAVLRSAWASHGAGAGTPMAVDLSSARARDASNLIDGVRNGRGLGELLGYRFERALHEGHPGIELDRYIDDFRELAPLVAHKQIGTESPGTPAKQVAAASVTDGLRLLGLWRTSDPALVDLLDGSGLEADQRAAIEAELEGLAEAVDGLADGAMAEALHHVLQGNPLRAGAAMEAVSTGEVPPSELEVTSPARMGRGVTHRLVLPLGDTSPAASTWPGAGVSPRARAEPELEDWIASLLPSSEKVVATASYFDAETGDPVGSRRFRLVELGLSAIDALMLAPEKPESGELGERLDWALERHRPRGVPAGSRIEIDSDWSEELKAREVALGDFLLLARTLRRAVAEARPLRAPDLALPTDGAEHGVDLDELFARGSAFVTELADAVQDLEDLDVDRRPEDVVEPLRERLRALSDLGVPGAFPRSVVERDEAALETLAAQRRSVIDRAGSVLERAGEDAAVAAAYDPATGEGEGLLIDRLKAVFGRGFPVLPRFVAANHPALAASFGETARLQGGDVHAAAAWLERAAKVRPRSQAFLRAVQYSEALLDRSKLALEVAQLPYRAGETWAGLPSDPRHEIREGRVSLVAQTFGDWQLDGVLRGLVLDELSEVIPNLQQTTGVSFHYDAPGARAPQSMLLLALIDAEPEWTVRLIQEAMWTAFRAMRRRIADSNALVDGGHFLPAVYLEAPSSSGQLAGDLERGMVGEEDGVVVDHELPTIDLEAGPTIPPGGSS